MSTGAPASAWRCARRSWNTTAAACGWTPPSPRGRRSAGRCLSTSKGIFKMTQSVPGREIVVLLVEDDPGDVLMTKEAFEDYKVHNQLHVVNDGTEAMAFLRRE